jgi:serine/threonine-protein kinase
LLPEGSRLRARYKIARVLSSTRLRNIYIAEDQHLRGNHWVIRQMQPVGIDSQDRNWMIGQFEAEARLISTLEHPNIPKLMDFFVQDSHLYVIREFVPGLDLAAILQQRGGRLAERDALQIGIQLADLMMFLLKKKLPPVIFRELCASNLVFTPEGQVKFIDFGFSRLFQREARMGSPDYAAPEQFSQDGDVDGRTLVYNVGALVYHLLTGHNPGSTPFDLPPIEHFNPQVSDRTVALLGKALDNEPKRRFANLSELSKTLQQALTARGPAKQATTRPTAKSKPVKSGGTVKVSTRGSASGHLRSPVGPGGTVKINHNAQPRNSASTAWLLALLLTLVMGGTLLAIYHYFLRPNGGF